MDANYMSLDELLSKTGNSVYKLVVAVAKRSQEIATDELLSGGSGKNKPVTLALQEICDGKIKILKKKKK